MPTKMDRATWQHSLAVALDDLAALVSPKRIIVCEGGADARFTEDGIDAKFTIESSLKLNQIHNSFPQVHMLIQRSRWECLNPR